LDYLKIIKRIIKNIPSFNFCQILRMSGKISITIINLEFDNIDANFINNKLLSIEIIIYKKDIGN